MRRPGLLLAVLGAVAWFWRSARSSRDDRDVWTAATTPPDLR